MNKILLADSNIIYRTGIKKTLSENDYCIVDDVSHIGEITPSIYQNYPDILFMGADASTLLIADTIKKINAEMPTLKIIAYIECEQTEIIHDLVALGINGLFFRNITTGELLEAVNCIKNNKTYFTDAVTENILQHFCSQQAGCFVHDLTSIERKIISLITQQFTNKAIAQQLGLGKRTVESYRARIMHKTGSLHIAGLIEYAYKHGLTHYTA